MKTAIIIHGWVDKEEFLDPKIPSGSNFHWFSWIQKQLLIKGILAQTPEMPGEYEPNYEKWKWMFEQFKIDEETILVGHSLGGGFLIRWLSENNKKVGKVVLVAPWINPNKIDNFSDKKFFEFDIDPNISSKTTGMIIMYSNDDSSQILDSIKILKAKLKNVEFQEFTGKRHFTLRSMGTEEFPELLENIIK